MSPRLKILICVELILAALVLAREVPTLEGAVLVLGLLLILDAAAEAKPIHIYGETNISVGFVVLTAIIISFGLPGAALTGPIEAIMPALARRRLTFATLHNTAAFTLVNSAAAVVYVALAPVGPQSFEAIMVPAVLLSSVVAFGLYMVLAGLFMTMREGEAISAFWSKYSWLAPYYLAFGLTGMTLALSYMALGVAGIFAFVAPALMIRVAMRQYVDKTEDHVKQLQKQNELLIVANVEIRRVTDELRTSYDGTLEALVNALDARDQETKGHSIRVSNYMLDIAREMGVVEGSKDWVDMQRGSLLHDVGKIGVSDSILLKPGKLTDEEWASMRRHPEIGFNMLRQVKFLEGAAEIILAHHERWDGCGYPRGLHEEEIPLGARIFTVVDTFDSMTSDRPYRKALDTQQALNEILRCSGTQFDRRVVEAFLDIYETWTDKREQLHQPQRLRAA